MCGGGGGGGVCVCVCVCVCVGVRARQRLLALRGKSFIVPSDNHSPFNSAWWNKESVGTILALAPCVQKQKFQLFWINSKRTWCPMRSYAEPLFTLSRLIICSSI